MSLTPSVMVPLGTKAPDFNLLNVDGSNVQLSDFDEKKVLVVMFICNHCPYVLHIKDGIIDLANDYENEDVAFVAINSNDPTYDPSDGYEYMKEEGYPFPYLYDETQEVAKEYNAVCTPDFFVYNSERELMYRGQFDNARPGNNEKITGDSLSTALTQLLNDSQLSNNQKPSSGCNIKWK